MCVQTFGHFCFFVLAGLLKVTKPAGERSGMSALFLSCFGVCQSAALCQWPRHICGFCRSCLARSLSTIVWLPEMLQAWSLHVTVLKARPIIAGSTREDASGEICRQGKRWPCCSTTRCQRAVPTSDCQWQWQLCLYVRAGVEAAANAHLFWVSSEGREVAPCHRRSSG